ncbi:peroxidase 2-like [Oryza brachyantha]|uniref:peroxidase 2-like n=1 Tax=Oryza brachyantha TaxID=4533 RepID=UPI001ADB8725|nr:peroxidase 2-like [Oryza brachyantha]
MKTSFVVVCMLAVAFRLAAAVVVPAAAPYALKVGYYNSKCGNSSVESIVNETVTAYLDADNSKGAALLRLFFHDCFVRGCDASILLDKSDVITSPEKAAGANIGIAGLDVIDAIKAKLEAACPGVVSCADIVVFAGRDATRYMSKGNVYFDVPAGRKDGLVSSSAEADSTLPDSKADVAELVAGFTAKGFTPEELVILSGAHSIGKAHCSSFKDRLTAPSSEINASYRDDVLNKICASAAKANPTAANNIRDIDAATLGSQLQGYVVPAVGGDYLDNSYYKNNKNNVVLFHSDWALVAQSSTLKHVNEYAANGTLWNSDFTSALVKLSQLAMPAGSLGQVRMSCRAIND